MPDPCKAPTLGVLLAAGSSRRFGSADKLLHPVGGKLLVQFAASVLLSSGCDQFAAIVSSSDVARALPVGIRLRQVPPGLDMATSFHAAITEAQDIGVARVLICLGDMPAISEQTLTRLLAQPRDAACCFQHRRLPPVLLTASSFAIAIKSATGDAGARRLLEAFSPCQLIPISQAEAVDVDRADDLRQIFAPGG